MNSNSMYRIAIGSRLLSTLILLMGCDSNPIIPEEQQLVVRAYLYEGEPVTDVRIMLSRALTSVDSVNTPVSGAEVVLSRGSTEYLLTDVTSDPGRYEYTGGDLVVNIGDRFRLNVTYDGISASAETTVPESPVNVHLNTDPMTFTRETFTTPFGDTMERLESPDSIVVSWDNSESESFFVIIENSDPNRQIIRTDTLFGNFLFRLVGQPTTASFHRVLSSAIEYTGLHRITVYRVNNEYVDLYRTRDQDSRSLNEPHTNVHNGMGVFTAFAGQTVTMNVVVQ